MPTTTTGVKLAPLPGQVPQLRVAMPRTKSDIPTVRLRPDSLTVEGRRASNSQQGQAKDLLSRSLSDVKSKIADKQREILAAPPEHVAMLQVESQELKVQRQSVITYNTLAEKLTANPRATQEDWARFEDKVREALTAPPANAPVMQAQVAAIIRNAGGARPNLVRDRTFMSIAMAQTDAYSRICDMMQAASAAPPDTQARMLCQVQVLRADRAALDGIKATASALAANPRATAEDWARLEDRTQEAMQAPPDRQPVMTAELNQIVRNAGGAKPNPVRDQVFMVLARREGDDKSRVVTALREAIAASPDQQPALLAGFGEMQVNQAGITALRVTADRMAANPKATAQDWAQLSAVIKEAVQAPPDRFHAAAANAEEIMRISYGAGHVVPRKDAFARLAGQLDTITGKIHGKLREAQAATPARQPGLLAELQEMCHYRDQFGSFKPSLDRLAKSRVTTAADWEQANKQIKAAMGSAPDGVPTQLAVFQQFVNDTLRP